MLSRFLPPAASAHAAAIDAMLEHVHLMVLVLFLGWAAYFIYVLVRFRQGAHPKASHAGTHGRFAMAIFAAVAVAEAVMLIGFALPLWFQRTSAAPAGDNPLVIRVTAEQFVWNVHYAGADGEFGDTKPALVSPTNPLGLDRESRHGKDDLVFLSEMHVPVNRPVLIQLASKDVIHSFGVPAMRVKQDVVPGLRTPVWFTPTVEGEFEIACSQLCGIGHHRMRGVIKVESTDAYKKFLADEDALQRVK
jgi:cytochrome c oxidase subunit 2